MTGNIPYIFDCWADLVVHLLLLKSPYGLPRYETYAEGKLQWTAHLDYEWFGNLPEKFS